MKIEVFGPGCAKCNTLEKTVKDALSELGITGEVDNHMIMLGARRFIAGTDAPDESKISSVYVSIDHKLRGFFKMENLYRDGLNEVIAGM